MIDKKLVSAAPKETLAVKVKITKETLRKHLKASQRDKYLKQIIRDTELNGFSLVVNQGNTGSWWVQFRPKGKTPDNKRWPYRSVKLGDTSTHSPDAARDAAKVIKAEAIQGRDPHKEAIEERHQEEKEKIARKTLVTVVRDYHEYVDKRFAAKDISKSYCSSEKLYTKKAVDAVVGQYLSDTGSRDVVLKGIDGIDATSAFKTADCSQHARKHMESAFSRLMDFCLSKKWIDVNPMASVPKAQKVKRGSARNTHLSLDEMASLWIAADTEEPVIRDMVRLMLLIPAREGTITNMDWNDVNLNQRLWVQPQHNTKNKEGITLQLSPQVIEILRIRKFPTKGEGLVFPSTVSGTPFTGWDKLKRRLSKQAGLKHNAWRFHDFRRSFVSILADRKKGVMKHDETVLDLILNHSASATRGGVLGVYQISERMDERKEALLDWSARLMEAVGQINKKIINAIN